MHKGDEEEILSVLMHMAKDKELLRRFLRDILTSQEYEDLAIRWQLVKELEEGTPQRDIVEHLGVSLSRINRGSRALQESKGGFAEALRRFGKRRH